MPITRDAVTSMAFWTTKNPLELYLFYMIVALENSMPALVKLLGLVCIHGQIFR